MGSKKGSSLGEAQIALLDEDGASSIRIALKEDEEEELGRRVWVESKKLWHIAGPSMIGRVTNYAILVITQAFAGHLGELELAAVAIVINVIVGFDIGFMLGMASALETLCGQAFGAKKPYMLGVYLQRGWIVLFMFCVLLLPVFVFASPILKFLGQPSEIAELCGVLALWLIPLHFSFALQFPLWRFLQSQLKAWVIAWMCVIALVVHIFVSWLLVYKFEFGVIGTAAAVNISWWVLNLGLFIYTVTGACPLTWTGFSFQAFNGLWDFVKLSFASGVMLCLENWYYRILLLLTGNLENSKIAVDALAICMSINGWEMMIPLSFFAATGVRVANELGGGNGKGAKFATIVAVVTSLIIGIFISTFIALFHTQIGYLFSTSKPVLQQVNNLSLLLVFTILLNSVQPVLSGVAVGSGWQSYVAYINLGCYYIVGLPLGILLGWVFHVGVMGIWAGMIFGGTAIQTLILAFITTRCNWETEAEKANLHVRKWEAQIQPQN